MQKLQFPEKISVPEYWSFSSLKSIEKCPRSYWYGAMGFYPDVWNHIGFPEFPGLAAIQGAVVHNAVQTIFVQGGGSRRNCIEVIKRNGGILQIITTSIEQYFNNLQCANFQSHRKIPSKKKIFESIYEMRTQVQQILSQIVVETVANLTEVTGHPVENITIDFPIPNDSPLLTGSYKEFPLLDTTIKFKGYVDVLIVGEEYDEIVELKTGKETESHLFQVQCYESIWLNSSKRRPETDLRGKIVYSSGRVKKTENSKQELFEVRQELERRIKNAENTSVDDFQINDSCRFCKVRHLCSEYWERQEVSTMSSSDFELFGILNENGHFIGQSKSGENFILFTENETGRVITGSIRVLNAYRLRNDDADLDSWELRLGPNSEVYFIEKSDSD